MQEEGLNSISLNIFFMFKLFMQQTSLQYHNNCNNYFQNMSAFKYFFSIWILFLCDSFDQHMYAAYNGKWEDKNFLDLWSEIESKYKLS